MAKKKKMSLRAKKNLVRIGKECGYLNEDDQAYILDPSTTEFQCDSRMTAARLRRESR